MNLVRKTNPFEIRLFREFDSDCWMAEFLIGGNPDAGVCALFDGEHVLPTAFLASAAAEDVLVKIARLNPHRVVRLT